MAKYRILERVDGAGNSHFSPQVKQWLFWEYLEKGWEYSSIKAAQGAIDGEEARRNHRNTRKVKVHNV